MSGLLQSDIKSLPLLGRGKVRDLYEIDSEKLLIVQSDRISAFDVVMNEPVPNKGAVLTAMSFFWFAKLADIVKHHLIDISPESVVLPSEAEQVRGRAMVVRRLKPLPIEAVCRGYLIGSGWKDYQKTGAVCGIALPADLQLASKLPEVIFTPATKAEQGEHDENISFEKMADIVGVKTAERVRKATLTLYATAAAYAEKRGIIIADTKFEFALDDNDELILIDEALTPDSSRFWQADSWSKGSNPASYDKQIMRDYLETLQWDKSPPPPKIPEEIIARTTAKYQEIRDKLLAD